MKTLIKAGLAGVVWGVASLAGADESAVTVLPSATDASNPVDFANAKELPLPSGNALPGAAAGAAARSSAAPKSSAPPGFLPGASGDGKQSPAVLVPQSLLKKSYPAAGAQSVAAEPRQYGTAGLPFTTARVDAYGFTVTKAYPFRAAGRLFFNIGADTYVCTASLIAKGVLITAAHCVTEFGSGQLFSNFVYVPAYSNGKAPYGQWQGQAVGVLSSYLDGTMDCVQKVVCPSDVAVIVLKAKGKKYPGTNTGWFGVGYNGYGFTPSGDIQISQLGYPSNLDLGRLMERTDAVGFVPSSPDYRSNTLIGTLQTQGSSGGPWLVNLGIPPVLDGTPGYDSDPNMVVGVTSWGPNDGSIKFAAASPLTSGNIIPLFTAACNQVPAACAQ